MALTPEIIEERMERFEREISKLNNTLDGNGSEGIKTKLGKLSVQIKVLLGLNLTMFSAIIYYIAR